MLTLLQGETHSVVVRSAATAQEICVFHASGNIFTSVKPSLIGAVPLAKTFEKGDKQQQGENHTVLGFKNTSVLGARDMSAEKNLLWPHSFYFSAALLSLN